MSLKKCTRMIGGCGHELNISCLPWGVKFSEKETCSIERVT